MVCIISFSYLDFEDKIHAFFFKMSLSCSYYRYRHWRFYFHCSCFSVYLSSCTIFNSNSLSFSSACGASKSGEIGCFCWMACLVLDVFSCYVFDVLSFCLLDISPCYVLKSFFCFWISINAVFSMSIHAVFGCLFLLLFWMSYLAVSCCVLEAFSFCSWMSTGIHAVFLMTFLAVLDVFTCYFVDVFFRCF